MPLCCPSRARGGSGRPRSRSTRGKRRFPGRRSRLRPARLRAPPTPASSSRPTPPSRRTGAARCSPRERGRPTYSTTPPSRWRPAAASRRSSGKSRPSGVWSGTSRCLRSCGASRSGSPADLIRLVWSRDCIVKAFRPHARVPPYDDAPVDDAALDRSMRRARKKRWSCALSPDALRGMATACRRRGAASLAGAAGPHGAGRAGVARGPAPGGALLVGGGRARSCAAAGPRRRPRLHGPPRGAAGSGTHRPPDAPALLATPDAAATPSVEALRDQHGPDRLIEGLIQGLLIHMVDGPPPGSTARAADKQITIRTLRQLSLAWASRSPPASPNPSGPGT